jgi:hypothetical protein
VTIDSYGMYARKWDPGNYPPISDLFIDRPTVYFSVNFLTNPYTGWRICRLGPSPKVVDPVNDPLVGEGILVKLGDPSRVWRLTGRRAAGTGYYEGRWPD